MWLSRPASVWPLTKWPETVTGLWPGLRSRGRRRIRRGRREWNASFLQYWIENKLEDFSLGGRVKANQFYVFNLRGHVISQVISGLRAGTKKGQNFPRHVLTFSRQVPKHNSPFMTPFVRFLRSFMRHFLSSLCNTRFKICKSVFLSNSNGIYTEHVTMNDSETILFLYFLCYAFSYYTAWK